MPVAFIEWPLIWYQICWDISALLRLCLANCGSRLRRKHPSLKLTPEMDSPRNSDMIWHLAHCSRMKNSKVSPRGRKGAFPPLEIQIALIRVKIHSRGRDRFLKAAPEKAHIFLVGYFPPSAPLHMFIILWSNTVGAGRGRGRAKLTLALKQAKNSNMDRNWSCPHRCIQTKDRTRGREKGGVNCPIFAQIPSAIAPKPLEISKNFINNFCSAASN